jgi:uncharacterized protein YndB with AHSA1/START domain
MPNIRHELLIGAPAEKIYNAITNQEGLSAWWTPDTKAKSECNSVARFAFGPEYFKEMKIAELQPSGLVKWICITGDDEWLGTTISFELQTGDKETLLIFHHDDWKEYTPMFAECNYTWGQFLRSLKLLCETGKGRPWPNQHRTEP